jgi:hypothetical protein
MIPERKFLLSLIKIQNEIAKEYNLNLVLNNKVQLPNIPIIQGYFINNLNIDYYFKLLYAEIENLYENIIIQFDKIYYEKSGSYKLSLKYSYFIKSIHAIFFEHIKYNMLNKFNSNNNQLKHLNKNQKKYYLNYSSINILDQYLPGITLFQNENLDKLIFLDKLNLNFKNFFDNRTSVEKLVLFKVDEKNIIKNILLSKNFVQK